MVVVVLIRLVTRDAAPYTMVHQYAWLSNIYNSPDSRLWS